MRTADGSWEFLQPVLEENTGDVIHLWKPEPCPERMRLGFDPITSRKDAIV